MTSGPELAVRHERVHAAGGVSLHVAIAGTGPPIILLHGFPENWRSWRHQIAPLASAGFNVWAPDLRGYNLSDRPDRRGEYALDRLADDVAALVRATGAARAHIGGHDWGGMVAWQFVESYPALTDRLLIFNAPHPAIYRRALRRPPQMFKSWYLLPFLVPGLAEWGLLAGNARGLRAVFEQAAARPGVFSREDLNEYVEAMSSPGALTAALNYYRANVALGWSPPEDHPVLPMRTLVVWGEQDPALSTVLLEGLTTFVPRVQVQRIPNAGHWVQHEAPSEVNRAVTTFLAS
jgi:pimeloyl-ACP methyl ester carboxylesterase